MNMNNVMHIQVLFLNCSWIHGTCTLQCVLLIEDFNHKFTPDSGGQGKLHVMTWILFVCLFVCFPFLKSFGHGLSALMLMNQVPTW